MKNRIAFIVPYFGNFNNYFPIWLHSCKYNSGIDWLLFTDNKTKYNYPKNVKIIYTTFQETHKKFQENFDFNIVLKHPYALCEFKVAFGEVYREYVEDYDFWGHCDIDLIWGNIRQFITDEILDSYNKISWRGHLTLYRNNKYINSLYKTSIEGIEFYKHAFSNTTGFPIAMDERAINYIFLKAGERIYDKLIFADLKIRSYTFSLLHFPASEKYKNAHQIFSWENGNLFRLFCFKNKVNKEPFAYIHFLKRDISVHKNFKVGDKFLIVPNAIVNYQTEIDCLMIKNFSKSKIYWNYIFSRVNLKYLVKKARYFRSKYLFKKRLSELPLKNVEFQLSPLGNECLSIP